MEERGARAGYRLVDHTADVGVVAWGAEVGEAFVQAARGMFEVILGADPFAFEDGAGEALTVEVQGEGWDELLVNWLAELVYEFDVGPFAPLGIEVERVGETELRARVRAARVGDLSRIDGVAIKAVTYHALRVEIKAGRTEVQVIFDI